MNQAQLRHIHDPQPDSLGCTDQAFLYSLGEPTVIHISGKTDKPARAIVTLLHGNEPSGVKAILRLIQEGFTPFTNTKLIIASVDAARAVPVFTHRMLNGRRDLNRCFGDVQDDEQGKLALAISQELLSYDAEAIIDLHNTSGNGPAFSVSVNSSSQHLALASHFSQQMVVTDLRLGAIMEKNFGCPIITVEAGGSQDEAADLAAYEGIKSFLSSEDVFVKTQNVNLLTNPRRLEIKPSSTIAYCDTKNDLVDVCIDKQIDSLNFKVTEAGHCLGWCSKDLNEVFALDPHRKKGSEHFYTANGKLFTKVPMIIFMATTRADIAQSDCLFYFVDA